MTLHREAILNRAIVVFGEESQRRMGMEECAELIQALCKYERNPSNATALNVVEEMVDVELMLEQLRVIFPQYAGNAGLIRRNKLQRLADKLEKYHDRRS